MSASAKKPWKRFIKYDTLQGGGRGKALKAFRGEAAYVKRLRRLELVILSLTMVLQIPKDLLDSLLQDMLRLRDVEEAKPGSGGEDDRDGLPVPHSGPPDGQSEGDPEDPG